MIDFKKFNSVISLTSYFNSNEKCKQAIIDEAVYRWNTRKMSESERFAHMFDKSIGLVRKWSEIRVGLVVA